MSQISRRCEEPKLYRDQFRSQAQARRSGESRYRRLSRRRKEQSSWNLSRRPRCLRGCRRRARARRGPVQEGRRLLNKAMPPCFFQARGQPVEFAVARERRRGSMCKCPKPDADQVRAFGPEELNGHVRLQAADVSVLHRGLQFESQPAIRLLEIEQTRQHPIGSETFGNGDTNVAPHAFGSRILDCRSMLAAARSMARACPAIEQPSSVSVTPSVSRLKSLRPTAASRRLIFLTIVAESTFKSLPAFLKLPHSAQTERTGDRPRRAGYGGPGSRCCIFAAPLCIIVCADFFALRLMSTNRPIPGSVQ